MTWCPRRVSILQRVRVFCVKAHVENSGVVLVWGTPRTWIFILVSFVGRKVAGTTEGIWTDGVLLQRKATLCPAQCPSPNSSSRLPGRLNGGADRSTGRY